MKKILFVTYGGGHVNIISLIYKYLKLNTDYELQVIGLTVSGKVLEKMNIPFKRISEYLHLFEDQENIIELGKELCDKAYDSKSEIPYSDIVAYLGLSIRDLIMQTGSKKRALEIFEANGRNIFNPTFSMEKIIQKEEPDLLIITCVVRMEKAAALVANRLKIPVLRIADQPIIEPMNFDCYLCVMNQYAKQYALMNHLLAEEKIFVTGQPIFSDIKNLDINEKYRFEKKIDLSNFKKVITFLDQGIQPHSRIVRNEFKKIASKCPENLYVIKLHPNQYEDEKWILNNLIIIKDINIRVLLNYSDVAVTRDSTAGLEAVLLDIPLVVVYIDGTDEMGYSRYGIAKRIDDITKLDESILKCCDPNSDWNIEMRKARKAFRNDDNALCNIKNVIDNLLQE